MEIKQFDQESGSLSLKNGSLAIPFDVLETDYESYAVIYSCGHWMGLNRY